MQPQGNLDKVFDAADSAASGLAAIGIESSHLEFGSVARERPGSSVKNQFLGIFGSIGYGQMHMISS